MKKSDFPEIYFFQKEKSDFPLKIFRKNMFFKISEKIFFSFSKLFFFDKKIKVEKKLEHHFDVEFYQESIFRIHKYNKSLSRNWRTKARLKHLNFTVLGVKIDTTFP